MFKILLIDRCHFTRTGFEAWVNHSDLFSGHFVVTGVNNLFLAREHILQWKPALVPIWSSLSKNTDLEKLAAVINDALTSCASAELPEMAAPLLTRQEERVLSLWMDGASNQKIASNLRINGKTVYTYKRNIRMKLHMDTRYSPFLSLQEVEN